MWIGLLCTKKSRLLIDAKSGTGGNPGPPFFKENKMELQKRQLEQLQQIRNTTLVPVGLLKMVERGNKARQPIFGGGT